MSINKQKLDEVFKPNDGYGEGVKLDKPVAILVQPSPDPDCLGAASGFSALLKEVYGLESYVYHYGEVSHPQNKSMKNVLRIALKDGNDFDPDECSRFVVLDTDLENSGFKSEALQRVHVRIDHHSMDRDGEPDYKDVRPVGSTCSMIWEYLREYEVDLTQYSDAATALILGIKTDTLDFTSSNTAVLDMEAYRSLLPFANKESLARVTKFPLPKEVFEMEAKAYAEKVERGTTLVSFIGELTAHSRDIISTIADRFARMAGVSTVVIMAVIDNHLQASVRSDDSRVDVHDLCIKAFGKKFAGGKEGSGGARVPLESSFKYIEDPAIKSLVMGEIVRNFQHRIFETLGEKDQEKAE